MKLVLKVLCIIAVVFALAATIAVSCSDPASAAFEHVMTTFVSLFVCLGVFVLVAKVVDWAFHKLYLRG